MILFSNELKFIVFFQIITLQKTASETVLQFFEVIPLDLFLPIFLHHTSVCTIFRVLLNQKCVKHRIIYIASKLINLLQDKQNCPALILQQYLEIAYGGQKVKKQAKIIATMEEPEKLKEMLQQSSMDQTQMMQAGTLVDWLSTFSAVELETGGTGTYKLQVDTTVK